jgi:hypothetical protein
VVAGHNQERQLLQPKLRIGVIIHYSKTNYGNHLVNLATRKMLEERGYETDLLVLDAERPSRVASLRRLPRKLHRLGVRGTLSRLAGRLHRQTRSTSSSSSFDASTTKRRDAFDRFSQAHLRPRYLDTHSIQGLDTSYDRLAIGSDQIWNFDYGITGRHFADFANQKEVVTLSPSVGHKRIPAEWVPSYQRWLSHMGEIGTRETEWTSSVAQPLGPKFTLLIDPTLMYDQDLWATLAVDYPQARGKILFYHLGEVLPQHAAHVADLATHHQLEVLHLSDSVAGDAWETNAAEFLGMVENSACVVTDSYHGAIFAFLFDKPLILLERHGFAGAMNTRTRTLTERLHLSGRYMANLSIENSLKCNYSEGKEALRAYRSEYRSYLDRRGVGKNLTN